MQTLVTWLGGPNFKLDARIGSVITPGLYGIATVSLSGTSLDESVSATSRQGSAEVADLRFEFVGPPPSKPEPAQIVKVSTEPQ